jgi:hypothetical protein
LKQTYSRSEFHAEHDAIIIKFSSKTCHQVALIATLRKRHFYCSEPFETNIFLMVRSIATTYVVTRRSKLSIATTSVVAIKRKLSIATIRLYFLSDLSYRGNNTNFVYCHDMRFRTKFHRRSLGKLLNRVKLHVHNSRMSIIP